MKVQTRTKISAWAVIGEKEKINLDLCDFSPEQVAELDRLIRADGENKVEITIEPEQKKLQIEPIRSVVKLVSLACRTGGQKLTVSGFRSPDERATAIKRLSAAETPILLTVQEVQMTMFDRAKREAESPALPAGSLGETPHEEDLNLACRGMKGACVEAVIECVGPGKWSLIGVARLGNYHYQTRDVGETDVAFSSRRACIDALRPGWTISSQPVLPHRRSRSSTGGGR